MEDLAQPRREPKWVRERRTALLAGVVGLFLSVPLVGLAFKRWKPVVPDRAEGFKAITQISGRARDTPRIKLEPPKERPILAAVITVPRAPVAVAKPPPPAPAPLLVKPAPPKPKPAPVAVKKPAPKKIVRKPVPPKPIPKAVVKAVAKPAAPPPARPDGFFELDVPAAAAVVAEAEPSAPVKVIVRGRRALPPPSLTPEIQPEEPAIPLSKTKPAKQKGPAVIVDRVPSNER